MEDDRLLIGALVIAIIVIIYLLYFAPTPESEAVSNNTALKAKVVAKTDVDADWNGASAAFVYAEAHIKAKAILPAADYVAAKADFLAAYKTKYNKDLVISV